MFIATPAAADPPLTLDEAKTQVDQLQTEAAGIDQEYAGVKEKVDKGKSSLGVKDADVKQQAAKVAKMKNQVGQVALAQFQNRNIDTTAQLLFTEDTSGFLSQISTVEKVSENQNTVLQEFQREQATLADLRRSAETDLADLKAQRKKLKKLRKASDAKVEESKAVLARLTEVERKRLEAEEAAKAARAQKAAEAQSTSTDNSNNASNDNSSNSSNSSNDNTSSDNSSNSGNSDNDGTSNDDNGDDSRSDDTSRSGDRSDSGSSSGSSKGQTALAFARNQIGKPYSFGATGPGSYDCSGLTGAAWKAAGVSLSRTSQTQINDGTSVSKGDLQPGDLVFYYGGLTHVALYAGNGQILHAPRPGKSVEYASVSSMPFAGARRPG